MLDCLFPEDLDSIAIVANSRIQEFIELLSANKDCHLKCHDFQEFCKKIDGSEDRVIHWFLNNIIATWGEKQAKHNNNITS